MRQRKRTTPPSEAQIILLDSIPLVASCRRELEAPNEFLTAE